tara:strand:- start:475 stop:4248 length:3774 start_codon:yes stop_codon:yes gene_type:complete
MTYDLNTVDTDALQQTVSEDEQFIQQREAEEKVFAEDEAAKQQQDAQFAAEQEDPRNREQWGIGGVVKELQSAFGGGIQDTASSIVTLPERLLDTATGEIQREQAAGGYDTEWDDWFTNDDNPIETKTWWGGLIRSATHFGTLGGAIVAASPLLAAGGTALGAGRAVAAVGSLAANQWARAAAVGAATDLVSKYSQDANGLQILRDRYGFIDTPITTNDTDHPTVKTFKNVVEGMGIGELANGIFRVLGKAKKIALPDGRIVDGTDEAVAKGAARSQSVDAQVLEKGQKELLERGEGFGGHKNKPMANPSQGSPTSTENVLNVKESQTRIRREWGAEEGSPGSVTTPSNLEAAARTNGLSDEALDGIYKGLVSDARYQVALQQIREGGTTLRNVAGDAIETFQRTGLGREAADISPEQYLAEYFEGAHRYFEDSPEEMLAWTTKNVQAADLLVGSLVREIRDLGLAGRELQEFVDLGSVDGPAKALYDKLITATTEIKRSQLLQSQDFRAIGENLAADPKKAVIAQTEYVNQNLSKQVGESIDAWRLAFQIAGEDANDDLFKAIFETVSMNKEIHNLTDFDNWIRKKVKGGEFNGEVKTGALLNELHRVMINSVLSGPKTPMRAIMGTSSATFLRPMSQVVGSALRFPFTGDGATLRASLAQVNAMRQAVPEAFEIFKTRLNSYWNGDVATVKSRFMEYTKGDEQWEMFRNWAEDSGRASAGDQAAFKIANMARSLNDNKFLTYSTKVMAATDDSFTYILQRARAREKAVREALEASNGGRTTQIDAPTLRDAENRFLAEITDADGNIIDTNVQYAKKEVTLTKDLTGFAKGLETAFQQTPWARPFFLFARTGVNGLTLTAKHTPGFNFLVKEFNEVAFTKPGSDLGALAKYGIETTEDLLNAKALQTGRLAIGSSVITMAGMHFMNGGLTGNGPTDRSMRQVWMDAGWQPRSVNIGGVWVGYDSFEPFNQILSAVADIGDHNQLMGEEWTQDQFQKLSLVIAQAAVSKSYLQGLQGFVDLFSGKPGQQNRVISGILNNQIPLAGLRNEVGKLFTPHMKELNSGWQDAIRNRNLLSEKIAGQPLAIKYDMLNGQPIREYDFVTRMWNMFIPVSLNLDQGPGRKLLFESGYDLRMSTYYGPDGTDLSDSPQLRSKFQKAIGDQNLELQLNKLAADPRVQSSIARMNSDLRSGRKEIDPMNAYLHNKLIARLFLDARRQAWKVMMQDHRIQNMIQQEQRRQIAQKKTLDETSSLLQMNR